MNKQKITIIILSVLLVLTFFYFLVLPKYNQEIYNKGLYNGAIQLINNQMNTGNIYLLNNGTIFTRNINEICAGLK